VLNLTIIALRSIHEALAGVPPPNRAHLTAKVPLRSVSLTGKLIQEELHGSLKESGGKRVRPLDDNIRRRYLGK